ncbi:hypothetical protein CDO46_03640 [Pigmentiphaga sp. NML030171]|nr:hypothetical protein CDO46_03640 [Pigmentiphaga sp. NML030171]
MVAMASVCWRFASTNCTDSASTKSAGIGKPCCSKVRSHMGPITISPALQPELPTIAERFPDYEINSWYGVMAPAGTPQAIIDKLQGEIAAIVKLPDVARQLEALGLAPG